MLPVVSFQCQFNGHFNYHNNYDLMLTKPRNKCAKYYLVLDTQELSKYQSTLFDGE